MPLPPGDQQCRMRREHVGRGGPKLGRRRGDRSATHQPVVAWTSVTATRA